MSELERVVTAVIETVLNAVELQRPGVRFMPGLVRGDCLLTGSHYADVETDVARDIQGHLDSQELVAEGETGLLWIIFSRDGDSGRIESKEMCKSLHPDAQPAESPEVCFWTWNYDKQVPDVHFPGVKFKIDSTLLCFIEHGHRCLQFVSKLKVVEAK